MVDTVPQGVAEAARLLCEGAAEAALAALRGAGAENPEDLSLQFVTALIAWRLGETAQALALGRAAFDRDPENGTIAEVVASLYAQAGNLVESLFFGKLATALKPHETMRAWVPSDFPSFGAAFLSIREKPLLARGKFLLAGGKLHAALDQMRQHVEVAPGDQEGRLLYAAQLLRAGFAGQAVDTLRPQLSQSAVAPAIASLAGQALAAVGEGAEARHWHDYACAMASDDAAITAARIADAPWIDAERTRRMGWIADWVARLAPPAKPRRWRPARESLVIGYLVAQIPDRRDAAAIAAVAMAHSRPSTTVIGYGLGGQSWDENAALGGAVDKWRDINGLDPRTLAKTIAADGVDVVIDVAGFAAPNNLHTLAHVNTAIRTAWLWETEGLNRVFYDATIGSPMAELVGWQPSFGAYPLLRDWSRPCPHTTDASFRFGADATLAEITVETVAQWRSALTAVPGAVLLLRGHDMAYPRNVDRLVERLGPDLASRVDVVQAAAAEEFYPQVDVALAPVHSLSPHMTAEAVACGVPVLALGDGIHARALRQIGLGDFVVADAAACAAAAGALAKSSDRLDEARRKVAAVAERGESAGREVALAIERGAKAMLGKAAA